MSRGLSFHVKLGVVLLLVITPTSHATWSIVITNSETKEVAVGTSTCLNFFDLLSLVPVVVVGKGTAAVQSAGDFDGLRRPIIFQGLQNGFSPADLLAIIASVDGLNHRQRQYGIADTQGRKITFSGSQNGAWAGGMTGTVGPMAYAIQGNVLTGPCVVQAIEQALLTTAGDIPEKLMAGMQAARQNGGDGRCSCNTFSPDSCGCPPGDFTKAAHIGTMVVARAGDSDDVLCNASGCADGDYFMKLNVSFQASENPDPVLQLQSLFDAWRTALNGRPDAIESVVTFNSDAIAPDGASSTTMNITLLDWDAMPIDVAISSLAVAHAPDSDGISTIGSVVDNGDGSFTAVITSGISSGTDRFTITVDDGSRPVTLIPEPTLAICSPGAACEDLDPCTENDTCSAASCAGTPIVDASPSLIEPPLDTTVCEGDAATLTVVASGLAELAFQWRKGGINVQEETNSTLTIDPASLDDTGSYTVVVTNACGSVMSDPAALTVIDPLECIDTNVCTIDTCDTALGCLNNGTGVTVACDDGNLCTTGDVCQGDAAGTCAGTDTSPVDCDDGNDCTVDTCDPALSCLHDGTGITDACNDGDPCTLEGLCLGDASGSCVGGAPHCQLLGDVFPFDPQGPDGSPVGNCLVDIDDLLVELGAFAVSPNHCKSAGGAFPDTTNLFPCGEPCAAGVVDIDDVVAMLGAFGDDFACPHPCPP